MDIKKPVENVLEQTLKNLRAIVDVDCIVGNSIVKDETTIIPISKVSVGFVSGGGEYDSKKKITNHNVLVDARAKFSKKKIPAKSKSFLKENDYRSKIF